MILGTQSKCALLALLIINLTCAASCRTFKDAHDENLLRAREMVLRDTLFQMRKMIDQYAADQGALPQSLNDLVERGYLRDIPTDPMTEQKDWQVIMEDDPNRPKGTKGVADIRSSSKAKSSEGTPYSEW